MLKYLLLISFILFSRLLYAQGINKEAPRLRNNAVYVEVLGATYNTYALGYERTFARINKLSFHARMGIGAIPGRLYLYGGWMYMNANAEVGMLWGGLRNKLELGIGFAYSYSYTYKTFGYNPARGGSCGCVTDMKTIPMRIGYRRISKKDAWFYHFAFTPYLFLDRNQLGDYYENNFIEPALGLGIGVKF